MFAIFSALYDSIQASRLILRAPTVSPSIRNMYNSTACYFLFFSFFFYKHTLILLPGLSEEAIQGKKRIVCLGDRAEGCGGVAGVGGLVQLFIPLNAQSAANTIPMLFLMQAH